MPQRMTRDLRVCREGSYYDLGDCGRWVGGDTQEVWVSWDRGAIQRLTATSNLLIYFNSMIAGRRLVLALEQDATGGRTVTWMCDVRWLGGTAPTLSADPGAVDLIEFLCMGARGARTVYGRLWGRWAVP